MGQQFKVGDRVRLVRDTDDGKLKAVRKAAMARAA
jgi:hypothetical protein